MIDFTLTEEQQAIRDMAEAFALAELAPQALDWDARKHFPLEALAAAGALGLGAIYTRDDVGGSGLGRMEAAVIFEALAKGCPTIAAYISIHNMCCWMIDAYGSPTQREEWCPRLATMQDLGSYCLTEPGAGSDAAALSTKAVREGGDYVLSGQKQFISGAGASAVYVVMARTGEPGPKGISAFLVPKDAPGLSFGANETKMGWNAQPTRVVNFDNVRLPADSMLGQEGRGFNIAMAGLNGGRLNIAACSLGGAQRALDLTIPYLRDRKAFGGALLDQPTIRFKLAEMATELEAARLILWRGATALDAKSPEAAKLCAMAKLFVTDRCFDIVDSALQMHGGYGYLSEYGIEKILRDLRVHRILEGANEIMRLVISRAVVEEHQS